MYQLWKMLFFGIFLFLVTDLQARFDFSRNSSGEWEATTLAKRGESLGNVLRDLGVEPNWQNRSWVSEISLLNPTQVLADGHIVNIGELVRVPIQSLSQCEGYDILIGRLQAQALPPLKVQPVPSIEPSQDVIEKSVTPEEPLTPTRYSLRLRAGGGVGQLTGDDNQNFTADFTTDISAMGDMEFFIHFNENWDLNFFGRLSYYSYQALDNITSSVESDLYASGGLDLRRQFGRGFWLGVVGEFRQSPWVDFNITSLDVDVISYLLAGLSVDIRVFKGNNYGLYWVLIPQYLFPTEKNNVTWDGGFGAKTRVEWAPINFQESSGWVLGAEYIFESQSATHANNNTSDQISHNALGYLGYHF